MVNSIGVIEVGLTYWVFSAARGRVVKARLLRLSKSGKSGLFACDIGDDECTFLASIKAITDLA